MTMQRKAGDPESLVVNTKAVKSKLTIPQVQAYCKAAGVEYRPGDENHIVRYIASSQAVDRESDIMVMAGGDFTLFKTNPVFIWAHDLYEIPLGTVINLEVQGEQLVADVLYHCITEVSQDICAMALAGHIKAVSIGFRGLPGGVKFPDEATRQSLGMRPGGLIFERWELHELSQCPVGMNQEALQVRSLNKKTIALLKGENPTTLLDEEDIPMKPDELTKAITEGVAAGVTAAFAAQKKAVETETETPPPPAPAVPPVKVPDPPKPEAPAENKTLSGLLTHPSIVGVIPKTGIDAINERFNSVKAKA